MLVKTMIVAMDAQGHLTLPEEARQALHVEGETYFLAEATEAGIVLRPVLEEDLWAYTPEHLAQLERALQSAREGKILRLGPADLERLIAEAE